MKEVKYNIQTLIDGVEVSSLEGTKEITEEQIGELGTNVKFVVDTEMQIAQGGPIIRPKNPRI